MIRNFTLTNALGASFSLMNAQQGAFFEPQGLGFNDATQYEQVGEFFAPLTQRYGQQVITGSMVFGSQPYEHYLTFTKFCQHAPLSLVYETDAGAFQIPCRLTKIEKGDTDGWTYLECNVEFTALARMYKTVTANNTGTAGGGKVYLAKDLPDITGSIITIDNAEAGEVLNITADIDPIQDLHGYDAPWVGGAGKNKLDPNTISGNAMSGTITQDYYGTFRTTYELVADTTYTLSFDITTTIEPFMFSVGLGIESGGYAVDLKSTSQNLTSGRVSLTFTPTSAQLATYKYLKFRVPRYSQKQDVTYSISNIQLEQGSTATAWTPYENICPISGHTEVDVVVSPTTDAADGTTYTTALGRTVYGGTLDLVSGVLTVTHGNIASYNGETLPSTWISDRDVYVSGTTPTTGAQVVYELATPQTYQLTPQQIQAVLGNVWANSGDITITGRKTYGYEYNYTYGDFVADTVTIDSDSVTASPCRISIFGECTQPTWRHYLDGNSVATGYYNGTIPSGHKLVIDTTSSPYSIEEQDIAGNLIADRYELCDFSTERFFLLEYGHNTISVSHTDPDSIRLMVEGYIFYETV